MFRLGAATLISAFVFFVFLIHLWVTHSTDADTSEAVHLLLDKDRRPGRGSKSGKAQSFDEQIRNETLGVSWHSHFPMPRFDDEEDADEFACNQFERVFVLNLPKRGDRLDGFTLAASMTGFTAEVMPGVDGYLVPDSSLPATEGIVRDLRNLYAIY